MFQNTDTAGSGPPNSISQPDVEDKDHNDLSKSKASNKIRKPMFVVANDPERQHLIRKPMFVVVNNLDRKNSIDTNRTGGTRVATLPPSYTCTDIPHTVCTNNVTLPATQMSDNNNSLTLVGQTQISKSTALFATSWRPVSVRRQAEEYCARVAPVRNGPDFRTFKYLTSDQITRHDDDSGEKIKVDKDPYDVLLLSQYLKEWPNHVIVAQSRLFTKKKKRGPNVSFWNKTLDEFEEEEKARTPTTAFGPYFLFRTSECMAKYVARVPVAQRFYNATNTCGRPIRLFMDIDRHRYSPVLPEHEEDHQNRVAAAGCGLLDRYYHFIHPDGENAPPLTFMITSSCRANKDSFHLHSTQHEWQDPAHLKQFLSGFQTYIERHHNSSDPDLRSMMELMYDSERDGNKHEFDFSIAAPHHNMRMAHQSSPKVNSVPLRPFHLMWKNHKLVPAEELTDMEWCHISHPHSDVTPIVFGKKRHRFPANTKPSPLCVVSCSKGAKARDKIVNDTRLLQTLSAIVQRYGKARAVKSDDQHSSDEIAFGAAKTCADRKVMAFVKDDQLCPHSHTMHPAGNNSNGWWVASWDLLAYCLQLSTGCSRDSCTAQNSGVRLIFRFSGVPPALCIKRIHKGETEQFRVAADFVQTVLELQSIIADNVEIIEVDYPINLRREMEAGRLDRLDVNRTNQRYLEFDTASTTNTFSVRCDLSECGTNKSGKNVAQIRADLSSVDTFAAGYTLRFAVLSSRQSLSHTLASKFASLINKGDSNSTSHQLPDNSEIRTYRDFEAKSRDDQMTEASQIVPIDVKCYLDLTPSSLLTIPDIVTSPESITKLVVVHGATGSRSFPIPHTLYIDEVAAFFKHLAVSDTLSGKRLQVWNIVSHWLATAPRVVWTDADAGDAEFKLLLNLRPENRISVTVNQCRPNIGKTYYYIPSHELGEAMLVRDIHAGKRVYIACDSRRRATEICDMLVKTFPSHRYEFYHAKCAPSVKATIRECEKLWPGKQWVIVTPSIVYGVDFNPPVPYFHCVYAFFTGFSVDYHSHFQMLERVRKPIDNVVYVCWTTRCLSMAADYQRKQWCTREELEKSLLSLQLEFQKTAQRLGVQLGQGQQRGVVDALSMLHHTTSGDSKAITTQIELKNEDTFRQILVNTLHIKILSAQSPAAWLAARIRAAGGEILSIPWETVKHISDICEAEITERLKREHQKILDDETKEIAAIVVARDLAVAEVNALLASSSRTPEQDAQIERYLVRTTYGLESEDITTEFVKKWGKKSRRERFKSFVEFAALDQATISHNTEPDAEMARRWNRAAAIESLMEILGVTIGSHIPDVTQDESFSETVENRLRTLAQHWTVTFPDVVIFMPAKSITKFNMLKALQLMLNHSFPSILRRRNLRPRSNRHENSDNRRRVFRFEWNLEEALHLLHKRRRFRNEHHNLRHWADEIAMNVDSWRRAIVETPGIDDNAAASIRSQTRLNIADKLALERYDLCRTYGVRNADITIDFLIRRDVPNSIQKFKALAQFETDADQRKVSEVLSKQFEALEDLMHYLRIEVGKDVPSVSANEIVDSETYAMITNQEEKCLTAFPMIQGRKKTQPKNHYWLLSLLRDMLEYLFPPMVKITRSQKRSKLPNSSGRPSLYNFEWQIQDLNAFRNQMSTPSIAT